MREMKKKKQENSLKEAKMGMEIGRLRKK